MSVVQRNRIIGEDLQFITGQPLPWEKLEGCTVLVSGAAGFLPAYMVETILFLNETKFKKPALVIGIVRNFKRAEERFAFYKQRKDLQLIQANINELPEIGREIHYIIHAASQASPKYYSTDPVGTLMPNVIGTFKLLELARKNPLECFLFFSSGEVYGVVSPQHIPMKEDDYGYVDPATVRSCYGESKRMGETMCVSWYHQYGVPAKIARPFHTYGPGMDLDDGRVFADFVRDVVNGRDITMTSDGSAIRPFCYLSDAIAGFFTVMLKGKNGEAYNVGNQYEEISIMQLAQTLVDLFPEKGLRVISRPDTENVTYMKSNIPRNCPEISKIKSLGWDPHITVLEGFKRTILSYSITKNQSL